MSVTQSVQRGAALLDDKNPGWYKKIQPASLDLNSIDRCVLGQVYGDFGNGLVKLGLATGDGGWWGFIRHMAAGLIAANKYGFGSIVHIHELEALWRHEVSVRRLADFKREQLAQRMKDAANVPVPVQRSLTGSILAMASALFLWS